MQLYRKLHKHLHLFRIQTLNLKRNNVQNIKNCKFFIKPLSLNKPIYSVLKIFFSIFKNYLNYFYDLFHIVAQEGVLSGKCPRLS